jgi:hypothetical protein
VIKFFLPYKIYRCKECGWRGFIYIGFKKKFFDSGKLGKKFAKWQVYSFLVLIFILIVIVFFYFEKIGTTLASFFKEILQR